MPATPRFDFDLADDLAILSQDLITQFNIGMVDVHQIPDSELTTFVDPRFAAVVYGNLPTTYQSVDAQS